MEFAHARAAQVKSNANSTTKRRKLDSGELELTADPKLPKLNQCSCLISSPENSSPPSTTSVSSDNTPASSAEFYDNSSRSADLKVIVENYKY